MRIGPLSWTALSCKFSLLRELSWLRIFDLSWKMNDEKLKLNKYIMGAKDATRVLPIFQKGDFKNPSYYLFPCYVLVSFLLSSRWMDSSLRHYWSRREKRRRRNVSFSQKIKKFQLESEIFNLGPGSAAEFAKVFEFSQYERFVSKMKNKRMEGYI